jgi:cation diffusion facilitator CzcD-associated flavoprotein CzcO
VDTIVFATGFDAMTGTFLKIHIQGLAKMSLRQKRAQAPRTYLDLMIAAFPNLFTITGPGSSSVLTSMIPSIELQVNIIVECLSYLRAHQHITIEANEEAETAWVNHVNEVAGATLFSTADDGYNGANVPGKAKV